MSKKELTKKELKELEKEARMRLCSRNPASELDVAVQSLHACGYVDMMSTITINENAFINECTKILDKLMKLLSSKKIKRKYMRICTIAPGDPDSSEAFREIMNQWTEDNPYLLKISLVKEYIINEMRHSVNVYFGQCASNLKDVDEVVSKAFLDILNIKKSCR